MPARSPGLRDYRRALLGKIKIPTLVPPKNGGTRMGHPAGETRALRQSDAARESQNPHRVPPKNGGTRKGYPTPIWVADLAPRSGTTAGMESTLKASYEKEGRLGRGER